MPARVLCLSRSASTTWFAEIWRALSAATVLHWCGAYASAKPNRRGITTTTAPQKVKFGVGRAQRIKADTAGRSGQL